MLPPIAKPAVGSIQEKRLPLRNASQGTLSKVSGAEKRISAQPVRTNKLGHSQAALEPLDEK
jgi:hypothetical protein